MVKKSFAVLAGAALLISASPAAADVVENEPLYKYEGNAADGYGYGSMQVPLYPGSTENVYLPDWDPSNQREFRSGWVATIANLNFPQTPTAGQFIDEFSQVIADFEEWNMNALIFQVSPLLDSYYPSDVNPWSQSLTGTQGKDPGFDPLALMVDRTHQSAMEFHAWFNPYRVTNEKRTSANMLQALDISAEAVLELSTEEYIAALVAAGVLAPDNYAAVYPERVQEFDEKLFLDPGIPENQDHVATAVAEIVANYDVDAIHFDDYFYPYQIVVGEETIRFGDDAEDRTTFETYGLTQGYSDDEAGLTQWRLDNITSLIRKVNETITAHNTATGASVQLGVSPFGIWEHYKNDPRGSHTPTSSSQTYSRTVFADTRQWIEDELVDYMAPQIYWSFAQEAAPYGELARWWDGVAENSRTHIYVGHALYKHVSNGGWDADWMNPEEIPNQMRFNQSLPNIDGSILFSYNDMKPSALDSLDESVRPRHEAKNEAIDLLQSKHFNVPVLLPEKPWLSHGTVAPPTDVVIDAQAGTISWNDSAEGSRYFAIYAGHGDPQSIANGHNSVLVDTVWAEPGPRFSMQIPEELLNDSSDLTWVVTALDAASVMSQAVAAEPIAPEETPSTSAPAVPPATEPAPSSSPTTPPATPTDSGTGFVIGGTANPGGEVTIGGTGGASDAGSAGSSGGGDAVEGTGGDAVEQAGGGAVEQTTDGDNTGGLPSTGAAATWGIAAALLLMIAGIGLLRVRRSRIHTS